MLKMMGLLISWFLVAAPHAIHAAAADQDFYRGKTIRFVVGFAAGGGFDAYARAIARHMSRHISGDPSIIVENMTGAGSRVAKFPVQSAAGWISCRQLHRLAHTPANHGRQGD